MASAFLRHLRTSISNSSPLSSFAWTSKTRGGCRGLSTYCCQACGEKRDSNVRAWRPSSAVFSAWHEAQMAWKSCFCPRTVCCSLVTWSQHRSPSKMPPHRLQRRSCCSRMRCLSAGAGLRRSARSSAQKTRWVMPGSPSPLYSKSSPRGSLASQRWMLSASAGSCRILQVPSAPSLRAVYYSLP